MSNPFFLHPEQIGPLKLHPWTVTTQVAILKLKMGEWPEQKQVMACAWMQSQDAEELEASINDGTASDKINKWCAWFPLALFKQTAEWAKRQSELVEDGRVEVIEKPKSGKGDKPKN